MTNAKSSVTVDVLDDDVLRRLAERGEVRRYPVGSIIINEHDPGDSLFIIVKGRVKTFSMNSAGKEVAFDEHGPGEYVGELCLYGGRRSTSVITLEPTSCSIVRSEQLGAFMVDHPDFAIHLVKKLIQLARQSIEKVKSLALLDVYGRLVQFLTQESVVRNGEMIVERRYTQQEIADRVGCSREMVSVILKDLSVGGYISIRNKQFVIHRPPPAAW
jgi:CRP/FNR family cyclic AMP-dependent transcriptional regulator